MDYVLVGFKKLLLGSRWRCMVSFWGKPHRNQSVEKGRKEVRHWRLHPDWWPAPCKSQRCVWCNTWRNEVEGGSRGRGAWSRARSLTLTLPDSLLLLRLPERNSIQRSSTAAFIYRSIFSPSQAQLFLTNMSSSPARPVQWDVRQQRTAVQWEAGKGVKGRVVQAHGKWTEREDEQRRPLTLMSFQSTTDYRKFISWRI